MVVKEKEVNITKFGYENIINYASYLEGVFNKPDIVFKIKLKIPYSSSEIRKDLGYSHTILTNVCGIIVALNENVLKNTNYRAIFVGLDLNYYILISNIVMIPIYSEKAVKGYDAIMEELYDCLSDDQWKSNIEIEVKAKKRVTVKTLSTDIMKIERYQIRSFSKCQFEFFFRDLFYFIDDYCGVYCCCHVSYSDKFDQEEDCADAGFESQMVTKSQDYKDLQKEDEKMMTRFEVMGKAAWKAIDTIQDSGYNVSRFTVDEVSGTITIYVPEH